MQPADDNKPWPPTPGRYMAKLRRGAPWVPVLVWFGRARDPVTLEGTGEGDAEWRALVGLEERAIDDVWPRLCYRRASNEEFDRLRREVLLATMDPSSPHAKPWRKVDFTNLEIPEF